MLTSPESELAQDASTRGPAWHELHGVLMGVLRRREALCFWSESWLGREALLTRIVERVRSTRMATALEVDDGWHGNRDVSLQLGRWGRFDVQMLVEEHAGGKVLVRIARRLRVTPYFAAAIASLILMAGALIITSSGFWLTALPVAVMAALMTRAFWHAGGIVALADAVMTRVLLEAGSMPLGAAASQIAARITAPASREGELSLRRLDRSTAFTTATTLPPTASTARHAS